MTFTLTREQLYDLVWSEPMQRLAKKIGISDVAIAKHCRKLGVPVPERGYWNKLQVGKPVTKKRTRLKFLSPCTNRSVTKKRSSLKPSKQLTFGKRHMQEINKQTVIRNPGEKRENKRN